MMSSAAARITVRTLAHHESPLRNERLTGEVVRDRAGGVCQPSEAHAAGPGSAAMSRFMQRELNYLSWLAAGLAGAGRVVELGCFLGESRAALAHGARLNPRIRLPIISYGSIEIPGDSLGHRGFRFDDRGLRSGERIGGRPEPDPGGARSMFEVREDCVQERPTRGQEKTIYPEQEPIELLLVDIAGTCGSHLNAMRTFVPRLVAGGILVQHNFLNLFTPWVALHMWRMRDLFEPLDVIHGSSTISFRRLGSPAGEPDALWDRGQSDPRDARRRVWEQLRSYWDGLLDPQYASVLHGHEAMHALSCGDIEDFCLCARRYDAWRRSAESRDLYRSRSWPGLIEALYQSSEEPERGGLRRLAAESAARRHPGTSTGHDAHDRYWPPERRRVVWDKALRRCRLAGVRRIALFGAGEHTRWLFEEYALDTQVQIVCVIDDAKTTNPFAGVPTCAPSRAQSLLDNTTAVLPSSDVHETRMLRRMKELFDDDTIIVPVYTHPDIPQSVHGLAYRYTFDVPPDARAVAIGNDPGAKISQRRSARARLGLDPHRPWHADLAGALDAPCWVTGCVEPEELAFIWDFIELVRPMNTIEIGTASGVSTALLTAGVAKLCAAGARIHSFDIAPRCYFDDTRHVGSAIAEMQPGLLGRVSLHAIADADDAAACFPTASVDLAFIDANHAHPAPSLDLLAIIDTVKPGAWVILHDIELARRQHMSGSAKWASCSGAQRLYDLWPFEKHRLTDPEPARCNIGAIRIPADFAENPAPVLEHLLGCLAGPYEMDGPLAERAAGATRILGNME